MLRVLKISAALAILGAAAGAVGACLVLVLAVVAGTVHTSSEIPLSFIASAIALVGCGCGLLVAPVLSWTLLRNVPIWRCATETAFATSFALIGAFALTRANMALATAVLATALAVARLKWAFRSRKASEPQATA